LEPSARPGSLLIVSNAETSGMYVEYCSWLGISARGVAAAGEAIRELRSARPDAVVVSERLPDVPGPDLARALRRSRHTYDLPIVLLASNIFAVRGHDPEKHGCDLVLLVPVLPDELIDRLGDLLRVARGRSFEAWLYRRGDESVWIVRTARLELAIAGPRDLRNAFQFDAETELRAFQARFEQRLEAAGFVLGGVGTDRRSGRERRAGSRNGPDRRAIH
jgi:DNA-binding response OmpR family regulator